MSTIALVTLLCNLSAGYDPEFLRAIKAMGVVESNNNPQAYNAKEKALGHLQIRPVYLQDVNTFLRGMGLPTYSRQDCKNPNKAMHMVYVYTRTYSKRYGQPWNAETIARVHNSGPRGWKKKCSLPYWNRVRQALK